MFNVRFSSEYFQIQMIEEQQNPIGFYQISDEGNKINLVRLFLHPDFHNRGIGKNLLKSIIDWASEKGKSEIELTVWENNPALFFYKKFGFKEVEKQIHKFLLHLPLK